MKVRLKSEEFFNMVMNDSILYHDYSMLDGMRLQAGNIITIDKSTKYIWRGIKFYRKDKNSLTNNHWFCCEHLFDVIEEKDNNGNYLLEF